MRDRLIQQITSYLYCMSEGDLIQVLKFIRNLHLI